MRSTAAANTATPRLIHAFKPGRHTTMGGEVIEFTAADLAATAAAYDPRLSRAPIVKGHPQSDSPAQGWVAGMQVQASGLFAQPDQVDPAFAEEVRAGRWGAVSMKFYRPTDPNNPKPGVWYPKHLGFLGAQQPAVKGLEPPAFAEQAAAAAADDDGCVCFAEAVAFSGWDEATNAGLWRNLREWVIAKFGAAEADQVVPQYQVQQLEASAQRDIASDTASPATAFAEPATLADPPPPEQTGHPKEPTVTEAEAQALRDENARLKADADAARQLQAAQAAQAAQADNLAFAEGLARDMRIPTAAVPLLAAVGSQLQQGAEVAFGEGDARQPLHQAWRAWAQALPPMAAQGEQATRERAAENADAGDDAAFAEADPNRLAQHRRILAHAKTHSVSYAQAAHAVMGAN